MMLRYLNNMKEQISESIAISFYTALVLASGSATTYITYNTINNYLEDRAAIAKVNVGSEEKTLIDYSTTYVAFDKSGDGKIDEIKEYRRGVAGARPAMPFFYILRYRKGEDREFQFIMHKYFGKNE
jgi:hypothetical protein